MAPRLELQALLKTLVPNVYFQPPPSIQMVYPCIVYERNEIDIRHANNYPYSTKKGYTVTVIDPDPDTEIADKVMMLPLCSYDRFFVADKLNHDVFTLFF